MNILKNKPADRSNAKRTTMKTRSGGVTIIENKPTKSEAVKNAD